MAANSNLFGLTGPVGVDSFTVAAAIEESKIVGHSESCADRSGFKS